MRSVGGVVFLALYALLLVSSGVGVNGQNANCLLTLPLNPLTATGLSTPFLLSTMDLPCTQKSPPGNTVVSQSFAQGGVYDPFSAVISVYNPLVIDQGTKPAIAPTVPIIPSGAIVALWFGTNANSLTLLDTNSGATLKASNCVQGLPGSTFGQFSYCNAVKFFQHVYNDPRTFTPYLALASDGLLCPTIRDFFVVDQDPSDNVVSDYIVTNNGNGGLAQDNPSNRIALANNNSVYDINGSDNKLISFFLAEAIGCVPAAGPDLTDQTRVSFVPALPLDELQANMRQVFPQARVPINDPMALVNGNFNLTKLNLYRAGVGQPAMPDLGTAFLNLEALLWCQRFVVIFPLRLKTLLTSLQKFPTLDNPPMATNLGGFLVNRFLASWVNLKCDTLTKITVNQLPLAATVNGAGLTTGATFNLSRIPQSYLLSYLLLSLDDTGEPSNSTASAAVRLVAAPQSSVVGIAIAVAIAVATGFVASFVQ